MAVSTIGYFYQVMTKFGGIFGVTGESECRSSGGSAYGLFQAPIREKAPRESEKGNHRPLFPGNHSSPGTRLTQGYWAAIEGGLEVHLTEDVCRKHSDITWTWTSGGPEAVRGTQGGPIYKSDIGE